MSFEVSVINIILSSLNIDKYIFFSILVNRVFQQFKIQQQIKYLEGEKGKVV